MVLLYSTLHKGTYLCEVLNIVKPYSTLRKGIYLCEVLNIVKPYCTSGNMVNNISTVHKGSYLVKYNNIKGKMEYNTVLFYNYGEWQEVGSDGTTQHAHVTWFEPINKVRSS